MHFLKQFNIPEKTGSRIVFCCEMGFEFDPLEGFMLRVKKDDWDGFFTRTDGKRWRWRAAHFCSVHLITETIFEWPEDVTDAEIEFMVDFVDTIASIMDAAFVGHAEWNHRRSERMRFDHQPRQRTFFLGDDAEIEQEQQETSKDVCGDSLYLMRHKNGLIKIGRSKNPTVRERTLQAEDPMLEMIHCFNGAGLYERRLHEVFSQARVRGEWFRIEDRHVDWIVSFMQLRQSVLN